MPQFIPAVIGALGVATAVKVALTVAYLAFSIYQGKKEKRKARAQFNASQVDRLVNVASTVGPRMMVLGRARVGGHVFFRGSVGANKEKFVMLVALAAHEIDAVEAIYLNDAQVTLDSSGYVQSAPYLLTRKESGTVLGSVAPPEAIPGSITTITYGDEGGAGLSYTSYQYYVYVPKARIRAYLGAPGQAAAAQVIEDFPSLWTAAHTASGIAYLLCEFWYDETAFPSGLPNVTGLIRGAKCFDPRTATTAWSENPAILSRHIITHPQFGKRTSMSAAEEARIIAAANACDTAHTYNGVATKLYRASLVLPFGTTARDALDDLVQAMAGQWAHAAGEFSIKAGVYTAPVMSLGDDDLAVVRSDGGGSSSRPITIGVHVARNEKFNVVAPKIWDAGQGYKQVSVTPLKAAALIARDGAELVRDLDMPGVFFAPQALHVAGVAMRDARDPLVVTVPFKLSAYRAELFDNIELTLARYGWNAKPFMVLGRKWSLDGAIELTLKETAAEIYQPDAAFEVQGYAENTALPKPWEIDPPTILAVSSGTAELIVQQDGTIVPRVRVQWAALADARVSSVEVQWQVVPASEWTGVSVSAGESQAFLVGVADGDEVVIRARSRSGMATSDWCIQVAHTVVGKTEPPPDVTGLLGNGESFTWDDVNVPDLAGYLARFQYGTNRVWSTAVPMHNGIITENPFVPTRRPQGLATVLVKAIDTTKNVSRSAAAITVGFAPLPVANAVLVLPQHPDFGGLVSRGSVSGGHLVADGTDSFWAPADAPMWLPPEASMWGGGQYAEMTYEFSVSSTLAGRLVLLYAIASETLLIEYRVGGAEPFWVPADAPMWAPSDAPMWGEFSGWSVWPGSLEFDGSFEVRFRLTLGGGSIQGVISELSAVLDAPTISEDLDNVLVPPGGARLVLTNTYTAIKSVQLTLQGDGGSGVSTRVIDKDASLGPLVKVIDSSGISVEGVVDANISGYY